MGKDGIHERENLERGLKSRHLTMIAIGGTIGTDCFWPWAVQSMMQAPAGLFWRMQLWALSCIL